MQDLLIYGTGVHACEMIEIVERVNSGKPQWNLLGFLAPEAENAGQERSGYPVFACAEGLASHPDARVVPDCSRPLPEFPAGRLASLIDPSAFVSRTARIGAGCVIYPNCYVGLNARLGDLVFCLSGSVINHDDVVEDRVILASGVMLAGYVHVEPDCYLGQASTYRQNLRIGRESLIGMGAVVVKDVAPNSVMVGNPARKLRDHKKQDTTP